MPSSDIGGDKITTFYAVYIVKTAKDRTGNHLSKKAMESAGRYSKTRLLDIHFKRGHMKKNITVESLDARNWQKVCRLSVSEEQKKIFPVPNVYWIGISRYEENTELYAIKQDDDYAGLIGCGYDEDGISGFINPLMIGEAYQRQGIAEAAMRLIIKYLSDSYKVSVINIGYRKTNTASGNLYKKLGFIITGEDEKDYFASLKLNG